ncbi:type IV pilus assembly protein PilM [Clostridium sp. SM-530-WT-3G]|uniref:type IV pilus assembly protein PilM n=1 Tax=Clostridium sp. SM-530-WT-3G TaxID=2725303 RepID=UPI00145E9C9F|nr:type IV pilus assembly protein PilM [Clostridium sp. SM-530-WT-3G]NME83050.1 type IV pilus assembly protein PilM [Clostridium sp. SM-530-WT-3G]
MKYKDNNKKKKKSFDIKSLMNMDIKDLKVKIPYKKISMKKMLPEKKRKVVAFDIGSMVIKIAEGIYYKDELIIDKCMEIPTPKDTVIDGEIKKDIELVKRIKEFLDENQISAKYGICTTNSTTIINREILIPKVEEEELDTVVRYEIQQYLPINLDDYILQVTTLNEEKSSEGLDKLNVRVIAYPNKMARAYYNLLKNLNLKPYALDVNYNAIEKLINYTENKIENNDDNSVAYIDMGAEFINVNIYKNKKLDFTRIIKAGGNEINDYLQKLTGMDYSELERMKKNNIDLCNDENTDNFAVREVVNEWIEKIEKIIQFYRNKSMGNSVDEIIIIGGSSKLKGLDKYFQDRLRIKTRRISDISKIAFKLNSNSMPIDDFMNVIGSVIRL